MIINYVSLTYFSSLSNSNAFIMLLSKVKGREAVSKDKRKRSLWSVSLLEMKYSWSGNVPITRLVYLNVCLDGNSSGASCWLNCQSWACSLLITRLRNSWNGWQWIIEGTFPLTYIRHHLWLLTSGIPITVFWLPLSGFYSITKFAKRSISDIGNMREDCQYITVCLCLACLISDQ